MTLELDAQSLLVRVPGAATLASIERELSPKGLTLGVLASEQSVADWLAAGAPGAPSSFADPADHLLAGLTATLINGRRLEVIPSPRRSVGPDLIALFVGAGERFGVIDEAWLRVHKADVPRPAFPTDRLELDPPVSGAEEALLERIRSEIMNREQGTGNRE